MLASVQTARGRATTLVRMVKRLGGWWNLWIALAVIWTLAAATCAWIDLPRAPDMPHDPEFLGKLSFEAASIMRGTPAAEIRGPGPAVWSDTPRLMRMSNGAQLTFPATTTNERAAIVAKDYLRLLSVQADDQRLPYLLEWLTVWLTPLLISGFALKVFMTRHQFASRNATAARAAKTERRTDDPELCLPTHGQAWE